MRKLRHVFQTFSKCESTVKIVDLRADQIYGPGDHGQKLVPWLLEQFDSGRKKWN